MSATKMVNFRATDSEVQSLDAAAKAAGMSRSDWIRFALSRAVNETSKPVAATPVAAPTTNRCPNGKPTATCPTSNWVRLPTNIHLCTTCGEKRGY